LDLGSFAHKTLGLFPNKHPDNRLQNAVNLEYIEHANEEAKNHFRMNDPNDKTPRLGEYIAQLLAVPDPLSTNVHIN
jgi:hypothetical protein